MGGKNGRIEKVVRKQKGNESCVCLCAFRSFFLCLGLGRVIVVSWCYLFHTLCVFFFEVFFLHHRSVEGNTVGKLITFMMSFSVLLIVVPCVHWMLPRKALLRVNPKG